MKKLLFSLLLAASVVSSFAQSRTISQFVLAGTMTNLITGPFRLTSIVLTGTNSATGAFVDSTTNSTTYVIPAYTNVISYVTNSYNLATNGTYSDYYYTNYFGVVTYLTNSTGSQYTLVDVTNTVAQTTNNLPSIGVGVNSTTPTIINNANTSFLRGLWFTNTSATASMTVTITGYPL